MVKPLTQLHQLTVFVIRPEPGASRVASAIEAAGGKGLAMPVMDIVANPKYVAKNNSLKDVDIAIFVSGNAVHYALQDEPDSIQSKSLQKAFRSLDIAVIGKTTAQCLREYGLEPCILPASNTFTSEALLESQKLKQVQGKRIVIFRGIGGRNKLSEELNARGAEVNYCEVYQRELAKDFDRKKLGDLNPFNHIILCSSVELIHNLLQLAGDAYGTIVKDTPLVVVSDRIKEEALALGFKSEILVSENATDQAVIKCLQDWQTAKEI